MGQIAVTESRIFLAICKGTCRLGAEDGRVLALPDNNGADDD
jgi:hypothetical protein